jgi:hypothetical protein
MWAVTSVSVVPDSQENLKATMAAELDPGVTVILERQPILPLSSQPSPNLRLDGYQMNSQRFAAVIETTANAILVFSEVYYPGWRAYIDGQEVPILRANHAFRAIELPAGKHQVELKYVPLSFFIGLGFSIATILAALAAFWIGRRAKSQTVCPENARF